MHKDDACLHAREHLSGKKEMMPLATTEVDLEKITLWDVLR